MAQKISLAVEFEYKPRLVKWALWPAPNCDPRTGKDSGDLLVPLSQQPAASRPRRADGWAMRDEFFRLKPGDVEGLLNFFNKWGAWHDPFDLDEGVRVDEVLQKRERFLRGVLNPLVEWLNDETVNRSPLALFTPRTEYPHFYFETSGIELAMHTTITIDLLRGVKFRLCARKDCLTPFAVESKHSRKFCTTYCGHLESVRKGRRKAKKAQRREHGKG